MKSFNQYNEELMFEESQGRNISIGSYDTDNFDICPSAVTAFENLSQEEDVDMAKVEQAAKHIDRALGVEKRAIDRGYSTRVDLEQFEDHASAAEELLDDLNDLENHQSYIRDVHEVALIDMLDIDSEIQDHEIESDLDGESELEKLEEENEEYLLEEESELWNEEDQFDIGEDDYDKIFEE